MGWILDTLVRMASANDDDDYYEKPTLEEVDTGYMQTSEGEDVEKYDNYTFDGKGVNDNDVDDPDEIEDPEGYWNRKMGGPDDEDDEDDEDDDEQQD